MNIANRLNRNSCGYCAESSELGQRTHIFGEAFAPNSLCVPIKVQKIYGLGRKSKQQWLRGSSLTMLNKRGSNGNVYTHAPFICTLISDFEGATRDFLGHELEKI